MLLKVGELAKKTGLTIRTLHHYDAIGLLSPSSRSDAGYRLYNRADIARLHAIQALRQIGMQLSDIVELLARPEQSLSTVVRQQITVLDRQIAQATDLRTRLQLLDVRLDNGDQPEMGDWLSTLELMSTYGKYFTPAELKKIVKNWKEIESEWSVLIKDLEKFMQRSVDSHSLELQPLARRWMELNKRWMDADFNLIVKWDRMYESEPLVRSRGDVSSDMVDYIKPAIKLRLAALHRYFSNDELMSLQERGQEWATLEKEIKDAIKTQLSPDHEKALILLKTWNDLVDHTVNHDPELRMKLITAFREDDILRAGSVLSLPAQQYIQKIWSAYELSTPAMPTKKSRKSSKKLTEKRNNP
jgi:DNA-binding transcriptional MerR regulator